jgi:hypothetical protein
MQIGQIILAWVSDTIPTRLIPSGSRAIRKLTAQRPSPKAEPPRRIVVANLSTKQSGPASFDGFQKLKRGFERIAGDGN